MVATSIVKQEERRKENSNLRRWAGSLVPGDFWVYEGSGVVEQVGFCLGMKSALALFGLWDCGFWIHCKS
ncbi:hypothetical protein MLD38_005993 [Melastoma candidum]|uniref:Uncharacterized protein n=1 Tax=Melastoma candidum TaxID=119954 RepID=A0ACB9RL40_9MYRT|nr:hypothetical protein MLD38_005993 [Melastoma candidum]